MVQDCIFCDIAQGRLPASKVYDDELLCAFKDIKPSAPVHLLIVPKQHLGLLDQTDLTDAQTLGRMLLLAPRLAREHAIDQSGYRLVVNQGRDSGQMVAHLHMHLLGGHKLGQMG